MKNLKWQLETVPKIADFPVFEKNNEELTLKLIEWGWATWDCSIKLLPKRTSNLGWRLYQFTQFARIDTEDYIARVENLTSENGQHFDNVKIYSLRNGKLQWEIIPSHGDSGLTQIYRRNYEGGMDLVVCSDWYDAMEEVKLSLKLNYLNFCFA